MFLSASLRPVLRLGASAQGGGADGGGGVFRIDGQNNDEWVHGGVGGLNAGGADPAGSMLPAGDGKLSGTTTVGGACPCFCGMLYRIDPATSAVEIVWGFTGKDGGASNNGVIFRLTLQSPERPEASGRRVMGMARNQREGWAQPTGRHRPAPSHSCAAAHRRAAPHVHYRPCSRQGGPSV